MIMSGWCDHGVGASWTARTVFADDEVVGHAAVYGPPNEREVTYWIDERTGDEESPRRRSRRWSISSAPGRCTPTQQPITRAQCAYWKSAAFIITGHGKGFAQARDGEIDEVLHSLN
jgi:hypothetical protein